MIALFPILHKGARKKDMRLYIEHRKYYLAYQNALHNVERIIDEREQLLARVQPKSSLAEHEREFMASNPSSGGNFVNKVEEYVIESEQRKIKERLEEAKEILNERYEILEQKEREIRKSKDIYNVIYTYKWIDGLKADAIIVQTGYSRSQVYNIIKYIGKMIERCF